MLYCTLQYGINLCSSCIHVLPFLHTAYTIYLLYIWCCHDSLHLWHLLFLVSHSTMCRNFGHFLFYHPVQYLEQPSPMQTVVYCFPNLAVPCQMLHSLRWIFLHSDVWYPVYSCMSCDKLYMLILCHPQDSMGNREVLHGNIFLVLHGFFTFLCVVFPPISSFW